MNRSALRQLAWDLLGTKPTDPFYPVSRVDSMLNLVESQINDELRKQAPDIFQNGALLSAVGAAPNDHQYNLATQAQPILDFHEVLELRVTDAQGVLLEKTSYGDLNSLCGGYYALTGPDSAPTIWTDPGIAAQATLYLHYSKKSAPWPSASDEPQWVPADYHDVIGLGAVELLFALGGEASPPPTFSRWLLDRRGALWSHMGSRSNSPQRVPSENVQGVAWAVRR